MYRCLFALHCVVLFSIKGFATNPETRPTALQWAQKWVNAVHTGYETKKVFYEKVWQAEAEAEAEAEAAYLTHVPF